MPTRPLLTPARMLLPLALLLSLTMARAADIDVAQKQWLAGQHKAAIATLQQALIKTPDEMKLRFALAVYRMEMGEQDEALRLFEALTQDFPDLPDPFNNMAVIHAGRGELDLARSELEQALRLQPDHAQAQENLGDLMLRLAARAYQRAQAAQPVPSEALALKLRHTQALIDSLSPKPR
ncbi:MAG: tetratricopeptide repeat protein [Burkholderiaceae bacterium]